MAYHLKYKGPEIDERLDLAGTALQEHQDISHLATKEEVAKVSDAKEDVIEDLEEIRSGAKLGATSIQEHQDISHLAKQADVISGLNKKVDKVEGKGLSTEDYTTAEKQKLAALDTTIKQAVDELQVEVAKKQDSIEDLEEIREGARKGATAIQEHQDISNLATKGEVSKGLSTKVDKVNGKGLSTEDFTSALKAKLESLSNYNDTELSNAIESLQTQFDTLVSGNPSEAINSFNEIIAFLDGVKDTQDLGGIIASIETQIASVSANIPTKVSQLENDKGYIDEHQDISHLATIKDVDTAIAEMYALIGTHNKEVRFFCIEPVTVKVGDKEYYCEANQVATVFVGDEDFEIIPTSNRSIQSLLGYPIPLVWHDWLEGVEVFDGIVFDMNELSTYYHWIQYYQNDFHVQKAQYANCVFWSDKPYTHSPFEERTNYTIYYSSQLPLCYSRIPENTYKPFYLAYGVNSDPNWRNPDYINSYSIVTGATQTFSYYGASAIGIFDMAVHVIPLPKDCRGLMYHAPAIQHAGVFDATKTTNFGAKKGSWQDAFGDCISLTSLYIQNLKASINLSWSPINTKSLEYIVNNAINTSKITISLSPYTWYRLTDAIRETAKSKNITLELITTNYVDDSRWATKQDTIADLDTIRSGAALGATALQSYTEQYKGTVTGIKVNGSTHNPSNGVVDLGTISADESLRIHFEPNFDLGIGQPIDVTSLVQQSMGITPAELYEEVATNEKKTVLFIHELMGGELQEISRVADSLYEGVGLSYLSTLEGLPSPFQLIVSPTQCQLIIVDMLAGYNSVVAPLTEMVEGKQDVINDLETIREGAAKGATALQRIDYPQLEDNLIDSGFYHSPDGMLYRSDMEDAVLESLNKADSALQSENDPIFSASPAASITTEKMQEWDAKQDLIADIDTIRSGAEKGATALQEHQSLAGYATEIFVNSAIAEAITNTINASY